MRPRAVLVSAVALITLAAGARGQEPNTVVQVRLDGVGLIEVEAVLTGDSVLLLPAAPVNELLGLGTPTSAWLTLTQLQQRFPPVDVRWEPRALLVTIADPLLALPASRSTRDQLLARAQGASPFSQLRSGPFMAFTFDALGREAELAGYNWRGIIAVQAQRSTRTGSTWSAAVQPFGSALSLAYQGGRVPQASARLALGPAWLSTSWARGQALVTDALVRLGRVSGFVSSQHRYAITVRTPVADVQVGRSGGLTTGRISYGPIPANPFAVPVVP